MQTQNEFTTQIASLQLENETLRRENETLKLENENLKKITIHAITLDEDKITILQKLFNVESIDVKELSQEIAKKFQFVCYHLEELQTAKMVKPAKVTKTANATNAATHAQISIDGYAIAQEGRRYIIENNLILE